MRYSISLILLSLLAVAALKGSLSFNGTKKPLFLVAKQSDESGDYNELSNDSTPPSGLNDEAAQYWNTLTPQQKGAVRQDIQNGVDPNQAVLNYSQKNNREPANVEGSGSHSTSENYDEGTESFPGSNTGSSGSNDDQDDNGLQNTLNQQNSNGSKPKKKDTMSSNTTKAYSGSGSTEDEDGVNSHNEGQDDPANHPASSGLEPSPGNNWD
ncbi:MAG: hypothetical protein ACOYK9_02695 [Chlamydiia bacterium]